MDYTSFAHYSLDDFLLEPRFREWVLNPSPALEGTWTDFLAAHPEKEPLIQEARQFLLEIRHHFEEPALAPEELETRLRSILAERPFDHSGGRLRFLPGRRFRQIAAAVVVLLLAGSIWFWKHSQMVHITTGNGEQKSIVLPDGSQVQINANSVVEYAQDWQKGENREVWLQGEGFFEVEEDPVHHTQFEVKTPDLTVEVLGTTFNVNSRSEKTRVYLEEGKINLRLENPTQEEVELRPGDLLVYSHKTQQILENRKAPTETQTSWKDGAILFDKVPLGEVFEEMETIYGVEIEVLNDSLYHRICTAGLPVQDLEVACVALERALGLEIERQDQRLLIQ